jgi:hypothetical protein
MKEQNYLYVEIGRRIPYFLITSIKFARHFNPQANIYYISDIKLRKSIINKYNIKFVHFDKGLHASIINKVIELFPEKSIHRRQYWLNSLLRLFAIKQFIEQTQTSQFVHMESDSLPMLTNFDYQKLLNSVSTNATCFNFQNLCVPTLVVIVDNLKYLDFIDLLEKYILEDISRPLWYWNDIEALNIGRANGYFENLPVYPINYAISEDLRGNLLFDTAIYGKYLLGEDPRNTKFVLRSGVVDISSKNELNPETLKWNIVKENNLDRLRVQFDNQFWNLAIIHNYAKRNLSIIDAQSFFWKQLIREANGESIRLMSFSPRLFLRALIDLLDRLIKKNGRNGRV